MGEENGYSLWALSDNSLTMLETDLPLKQEIL